MTLLNPERGKERQQSGKDELKQHVMSQRERKEREVLFAFYTLALGADPLYAAV